MQLFQQPPVLYTHILTGSVSEESGIHLGLDDIEIVRQSHIDGETSEQIFKWHSDAEVVSLQHEMQLIVGEFVECIIASGIVHPDIIGLTSPQILHFANDLKTMLLNKQSENSATLVR